MGRSKSFEFTKEQLEELYVRRDLSCKSIGKILNVNHATIYNYLKYFGIQRRKIGPPLGEKNPSWNGGQHLHKMGYIQVWSPEHPNNNYGYIMEHRLIMEEKLGRYLLPNEIVHHKDGNKQNNNIDNLELTNQSKHMKKHSKKFKRDTKGKFIK